MDQSLFHRVTFANPAETVRAYGLDYVSLADTLRFWVHSTVPGFSHMEQRMMAMDALDAIQRAFDFDRLPVGVYGECLIPLRDVCAICGDSGVFRDSSGGTGLVRAKALTGAVYTSWRAKVDADVVTARKRAEVIDTIDADLADGAEPLFARQRSVPSVPTRVPEQ